MRRPRNHAAAPMATNASTSRNGGSSNTAPTIAAGRLERSAPRWGLISNGLIGPVVHPLAQIFTGFEVGDVLTGQGDGLAGLGIASLPRRPKMQREAAEAADLDALPLGERIAHDLQNLL